MHCETDQGPLDLIRSLRSPHVTLALIGVDISGSGLLAEGRPRPRERGVAESAACVRTNSCFFAL